MVSRGLHVPTALLSGKAFPINIEYETVTALN